MKKIIFLLSTTLLFSLSGIAQINKREIIKVGKSEVLTGVIQPLTKKESFHYDMPRKLEHVSFNPTFPKTIPGGSRNSIPYGDFMIGKNILAKIKKKSPDYQFSLVTPGISDVSFVEVIKHPTDQFKGGKAIVAQYSFPCKLELRDKEGNLLKTFVLSDENERHKTTILPNFFDEVPLENNIGFHYREQYRIEFEEMSDAAVRNWYDNRTPEIYTRMEMNALKRMADWGLDIIFAGYGYPKLGKPTILGLNKKDAKKFPELNQQVLDLQASVEKAMNGSIDSELSQKLIKSGDYFASLSNSESSNSMRELCALNAGVAYLLGGDTDKAQPHLLAMRPFFTMFFLAINPPGQKEVEFFPMGSLMNYLRANKDQTEIRGIPYPTPVQDYVKK